jgi:hypothetical protein
MLSLILIALAAPAAAPAPAAAKVEPRRCALPGVTYAGKGSGTTRAQKLRDQPPANQYLAVVRHVGGCPEPAVVRTGIGRR